MDRPIHLSSGSPAPEPPVRRRGVFRKTIRGARWLLGGGSDWAGVKSIRRGVALIGDLAHVSRAASPDRERIFVDEDRGLDLRATAFSHGMTEDALRRRLEERRRQTARIAYATFTLACLFLIGWLHAALHTPMALSRIMLAVDFLPFCALFFLIAFYNGLVNFQIRSGRRANWREYLMAESGFMPR
jgi:hypothetical protein